MWGCNEKVSEMLIALQKPEAALVAPSEDTGPYKI